MHLCLVKLSPTPELSMQAFFGAKLVYKYDKYKVATLFFNIGGKKTCKLQLYLYQWLLISYQWKLIRGPSPRQTVCQD